MSNLNPTISLRVEFADVQDLKKFTSHQVYILVLLSINYERGKVQENQKLAKGEGKKFSSDNETKLRGRAMQRV